jgi:hypothetical protein
VPASAPVSAAITARIIHASLMLGMVLFWAVSWFAGASSRPVSTLPDRRVLYLGLFLVSALLFGAAAYNATRFTPPAPGTSQDDWWHANLGRAVVIWSLAEAPAILGAVAYFLTHDFRTLLAPFTGLLFLVNYRPSRLAEA